MKRYKRILILLGVLLVACAITFGVSRYQETMEQIAASGETVLEIPTDTVTALSWSIDDTSLSFHLDGVWLYDDDEAFPVNQEKITELLETFSAFTAAFTIDDVEDFNQYGLEEPSGTIHIDTADASYEINLGAYSTLDAQRYVSIGDGRVYLASHDPLEDFDLHLSDLIAHDELPDLQQVTALTFSGLENYEITYKADNDRAYSEDDCYFTDLDGEMLPLDTDRVESYLSALSSMTLSEYVSYNVSDAELTSFGLDDPVLTVTAAYALDEDSANETQTVTIALGRDPTQLAAEAQAEEDEATADSADEAEEEEFLAYARVNDSQIVYQISESDYLALVDASVDALRHQEMFPFSMEEVSALTITLEGTEYTLTAGETEDADGETIPCFLFEGEVLDTSDLESALTAIEADTFTNEAPSAQEEIRLTLQLDNENYDSWSIVFYRHSGTFCLAEVNGTPLALVARSAVVNLVEAVQAFVLPAA